MGAIDCSYQQCDGCGALQTDEPSWIAEAYGPKFHGLGISSAYRSVWCQALVGYLVRVLGARGKILDFGGGVGLLCRLLRDLGFDAWYYDRYTSPAFAADFKVEQLEPEYSTITAFEVFEHFPNPRENAAEIFDLKPDFVIVGTDRYANQGPDWHYIFPQTGQHLFFWSPDAHAWLAGHFGYHVVTCGKKITVYSRRKVNLFRKTSANACELGAKVTQLMLPLLGAPGLKRDEAWKVAELNRQFPCDH